jgi:hypothetical protein
LDKVKLFGRIGFIAWGKSRLGDQCSELVGGEVLWSGWNHVDHTRGKESERRYKRGNMGGREGNRWK